MKKLSLMIAVLVAVTSSAQKADLKTSDATNTLLWKVSGGDLQKPSFLFGTFHLLCKEDIHFSDQLRTALGSSDSVLMEMKIDDPGLWISGMKYMMMADGKTLKDLYTPAQYARLDAFFKDSLKIPLAMMQQMKPIFLSSAFYPLLLECDAPSGVEMELVSLTKEMGKGIGGLETFEEQASVFDSIPYEWQAKELMKNVDSLNEMRPLFASMVRLYKDQRLDSLARTINSSELADPELSRFLVVDRNLNWVEKLTGAMKDTSFFVAVGAGHLPGKDGLIALLRERGYEVTPLKN